MQQRKLFNHTRWMLTLWYAGVMGVIVVVLGLFSDVVLIRFVEQKVNQDLALLSDSLKNNLELTLREPERFDRPTLEKILPNLCLRDQVCTPPSRPSRFVILQEEDYYVRFLDRQGKIIAGVGDRGDFLPAVAPHQESATVQSRNGKSYHLHTLTLHTLTHQSWGYLQVARATDKLEQYTMTLHLLLLLGLPLAMLLVGGASWWLSGLAMGPIYRSYAQVQQFTADAAHELRTPLAATRATVESAMMLGTDLSGAEAQTTLAIVDRQVIRLAQLSQDLLTLSRMDQRLEELFKPCCLNDILNDLEEELTGLAIDDDIGLTVVTRTLKPLYISGNEEQIYRIFSNLITNAIYYTARNGKVSVTLTQNIQMAIVQIQDTGVGISPENLTKIFDRFYRINPDRSRQTGGAGLGLSIVQAMVLSHRGKIHVQSEVGKGSIFTITLPLTQPHSPDRAIT